MTRDENRQVGSLFLPATITLKSITPPIKLNDRRKMAAETVEPVPIAKTRQTNNNHTEEFDARHEANKERKVTTMSTACSLTTISIKEDACWAHPVTNRSYA